MTTLVSSPGVFADGRPTVLPAWNDGLGAACYTSVPAHNGAIRRPLPGR